ncbi:uncharacterized protein LOC107272659 isoform X2 [Cephus cinctus]|nr:uncharacterized protein LOC107272659 isoform X2 [Cephus cinctus]XP_015605519.1 uncharacterized protein LOC107272659 isoform X2 [Cephus cinctus]XP_024945678.1 uncharacterized protein LOC107272659 isoform X2 [Cephus cinctus]XP_024945679.1 uncharacterized protein LOC107272659 isoform X2 [Cephus cinctus]
MEDQLPDVLTGSVPTKLDPTPEINSTNSDGSGGVVVRAEEALIVVLVLVLWVAAIALFFNRWGKIRMLEPYQPKFQQQHRPSCAISDPSQLPHRTCSKFNIHCLDHPVHQNSLTSALSRPRQNSVFVGSSVSLLPCENAPRRAKSAFDLQSLVMAEYAVQVPVEEEPPKPLKSLEIPKPSFQRQRGMSICHFDRMDVLARPLQRERGMSICHFDRTDVLARPVQRERGMSICNFDRSRTQRESSARPGVAANFEKSFQKESRLNVSSFEKAEAQFRSLQRNERGIGICHFDRATTSSKSPEVSHNYKATCV